jgi:hypothetical protein
MERFKRQLKARQQTQRLDSLFPNQRQFAEEAYLSPFHREQLLFLNDSTKLSPIGVATSQPPSNFSLAVKT